MHNYYLLIAKLTRICHKNYFKKIVGKIYHKDFDEINFDPKIIDKIID